jgi:hypothetical protein
MLCTERRHSAVLPIDQSGPVTESGASLCLFLCLLIGSLIVTQLVKKLPAFYGARSFINLLKRSRQCSLSRER